MDKTFTKNERLVFIALSIIIFLFTIFLYVILNSDKIFHINVVDICLILTLFYFFIIYFIHKNLLSPPVIFYILLSIFNIGAVIMFKFNYLDSVEMYWAFSQGEINYYYSLVYYILSISFYTITILVYAASKKNINLEKAFNNLDYFKQKTLVYNIGKILFVIFFPLYGYIVYRKVTTLISGGAYVDTYHLSIPSEVIVLSRIFNASPVFLLIGAKDIKKSTKIYIIFIAIYVISMFQGSRSEALLSILTITLVFYFFPIKSSNKTKMFIKIVGIIAPISLFLVNLMRIVRKLPNLNFSSIYEQILENLNLNFIADLFIEFGDTLRTLIYAIYTFPNETDFGFGKTFVTGILSPIPYIASSFSGITESWIYTQLFSKHLSYSIGGNLLGELYYNFGWFGPLFMVVIAIISLEYEKLFIGQKYSSDLLVKSSLIATFSMFIFYIRGYFIDYFKESIVMISVIYIIYLLFEGIINNEDRNGVIK